VRKRVARGSDDDTVLEKKKTPARGEGFVLAREDPRTVIANNQTGFLIGETQETESGQVGKTRRRIGFP